GEGGAEEDPEGGEGDEAAAEKGAREGFLGASGHRGHHGDAGDEVDDGEEGEERGERGRDVVEERQQPQVLEVLVHGGPPSWISASYPRESALRAPPAVGRGGTFLPNLRLLLRPEATFCSQDGTLPYRAAPP